MMNATYKVLSAVLSYPTVDLQNASKDFLSVLNREPVIPSPIRAELGSFIQDIADRDLLDLQAEYVDLFDRTRSLSLHLFEHVHGESRDRGQAMVSLRERYRQAGLDISSNELPDYVPLFLEFLSVIPASEARAMLCDSAHILAVLGERLNKRNSGYAIVFQALKSLAETRIDADALDALRKTQLDDPNDLAAIDRAWEETEVRFGPEDAVQGGSCPRASDLLRRMAVPRPEKPIIEPFAELES